MMMILLKLLLFQQHQLPNNLIQWNDNEKLLFTKVFLIEVDPMHPVQKTFLKVLQDV
jgi:hypothetical protein